MLSNLKGPTRRNLQTRPKTIIKYWLEYQIENFPEKECLVSLTIIKQKVPKFHMEPPNAIFRLDPKLLKNDRNTKSTNQIENVSKKISKFCF
jgi:hypothetical protein